jgi:hypothetical protein
MSDFVRAAPLSRLEHGGDQRCDDGATSLGERKTIEPTTFLLLPPIRTIRQRTHSQSGARSSRRKVG